MILFLGMKKLLKNINKVKGLDWFDQVFSLPNEFGNSLRH
jgi:hypothetical protein